MDWLPGPLLRGLLRTSSSPRIERRRGIRQMSTKIAKELVAEKRKALINGKTGKDIMSILVKANASENPARRLSDQEMWAQMKYVYCRNQFYVSALTHFLLVRSS